MLLIGPPLKLLATRPFVSLRDALGTEALPRRLTPVHLDTCQRAALGACNCLWLTCAACQRGLHRHCMIGMHSPLLRTGYGIDCRCEHDPELAAHDCA